MNAVQHRKEHGDGEKKIFDVDVEIFVVVASNKSVTLRPTFLINLMVLCLYRYLHGKSVGRRRSLEENLRLATQTRTSLHTRKVSFVDVTDGLDGKGGMSQKKEG